MSEAGSSMLGRRQWLAATAATLVVAFAPVRGVWLSRAQAHEGAVALPDLDGELVFDTAAREDAADDFGHIVHDMPDHADAVIQNVLDGLQPEDIGGGPILCYPPFSRSRLTRPFVAMPDADVVVIFGLLRFAAPEPALVDALVAQHRVVVRERTRSRRKAICDRSVPFSPADWADRFGERFPAFAALEARFDPGGVLTPGQHIFPRGDSP